MEKWSILLFEYPDIFICKHPYIQTTVVSVAFFYNISLKLSPFSFRNTVPVKGEIVNFQIRNYKYIYNIRVSIFVFSLQTNNWSDSPRNVKRSRKFKKEKLGRCLIH